MPVTPSSNHFAAGAEVHGNDGHAGGVGFGQDKAEAFRNGIQMKQRAGLGEEFILALHIHGADVPNLPIFEVRLHLVAEVGLVLNDAGDEERPAAAAGHLNREMDAFVGVDASEEDEVIAARLLQRVEGADRCRCRPSRGNSGPARDRNR